MARVLCDRDSVDVANICCLQMCYIRTLVSFFFFDSRAKLFKTYEMFNVVDVQVFDFKLIRQMTSGSCRSVMGLAKRGNLWHAWISSEIFTRVF